MSAYARMSHLPRKPSDIAPICAYTSTMHEIAATAETMGRACPATHLRQAGRMLARMYDAAFRPLGLELSQVPVVATVAARGDAGIRIGELARVLVLDRTSVTRALRPLEQAGLLRVARSP